MRLGLYHEPVHTDGATFDTYGPFARYVLAFASHFDQVTVFAPTTSEPTYFSGCPLDAPNVTVAPLPFFMTHAQAFRQGRAIRRVFREHADGLDAVNARGTAPLAHLLWRMTRKRGVPFVYHFASDPFEVIRTSPRYRGPRGWFARLAYGHEFAIQKRIMRENYSFASGAALCERLRRVTPSVEPVITSSLLEEDYHPREDTCLSRRVRVLYVGYLREGKGLHTLLEAVRLLRAGGRNVELELVGSGELWAPLMEEVHETGMADWVCFFGHAVMGLQLNQRYNEADVFALPSLSEGSPKAVLEAMAHSLPVVATGVGNVPEMLDGGRRGVLLERGDAESVAAGIARVMDDGEFRRRCIREGYAFARQHGLEAFVGRMAAKIRQLVEDKGVKR